MTAMLKTGEAIIVGTMETMLGVFFEPGVDKISKIALALFVGFAFVAVGYPGYPLAFCLQTACIYSSAVLIAQYIVLGMARAFAGRSYIEEFHRKVVN